MWTSPKDSSLTDYMFLGNWGISEKKNIWYSSFYCFTHIGSKGKTSI